MNKYFRQNVVNLSDIMTRPQSMSSRKNCKAWFSTNLETRVQTYWDLLCVKLKELISKGPWGGLKEKTKHTEL